jgi:N6-L-threonylcarbamoyladenine synthase
MDTVNKDVTILAIESSCDETAAAVVVNGREVLSNVISSQIATHKLYGGVVPEIASREHIKAIDSVIETALSESGKTLEDMTAIAVTCGPGLVGALLVGLSEAKALAFASKKPLVPVHHIEGHIAANYIENTAWKPPFICLVVSGGHTHLVHIKDYGDFEILGRTRDDAAGEAYDKVARVLDIPYPGGPGIDKLAKEGDPQAIDFPRIMLEADSYDFSFSGLKSAVLNYINKAKMTGMEINRADVAASFQQAVVDVLVEKAMRACQMRGVSRLAMAGGVSANSYLRASMQKACDENGVEMCVPRPALCTDNAAMIGSAAFYEYRNGNLAGMELNAYPNLQLGEKPDVKKKDDVRALADRLAQNIMKNPEYTEYMAAIERLRANKPLYDRVQTLKKRMLNFLLATRAGNQTFEEDRYLSQEYYKIILDSDAKTYFENGLDMMSLFDDVMERSVFKCMLDVFVED